MKNLILLIAVFAIGTVSGQDLLFEDLYGEQKDSLISYTRLSKRLGESTEALTSDLKKLDSIYKSGTKITESKWFLASLKGKRRSVSLRNLGGSYMERLRYWHELEVKKYEGYGYSNRYANFLTFRKLGDAQASERRMDRLNKIDEDIQIFEGYLGKSDEWLMNSGLNTISKEPRTPKMIKDFINKRLNEFKLDRGREINGGGIASGLARLRGNRYLTWDYNRRYESGTHYNFIGSVDRNTTPQNIKSYVNIFFEDIIDNGGTVVNYPTRLIPGDVELNAALEKTRDNISIVYVDFSDSDAVARAVRSNNCNIQIQVDAAKWIKATTIQRVWTIYHELAHGFFGIGHVADLDLMFPYLPSELDDAYFFKSRKQLFDKILDIRNEDRDPFWITEYLCSDYTANISKAVPGTRVRSWKTIEGAAYVDIMDFETQKKEVATLFVREDGDILMTDIPYVYCDDSTIAIKFDGEDEVAIYDYYPYPSTSGTAVFFKDDKAKIILEKLKSKNIATIVYGNNCTKVVGKITLKGSTRAIDSILKQ